VAYAATSDKYLVVWKRFVVGGVASDIEGQVLTGAGALDGTNYIFIQGVWGYSYSQPALAYNHLRNEFLLAYKQSHGGQDDVFARRVKMAGGVGLLGNVLSISVNPSENEHTPAVAAFPYTSAGQYLVVYESDGVIFGKMVTGEGIISATFVFSTSGTSNSNPAVDSNGSFYLIVWTESSGAPSFTSSLYGRILNPDGTSPVGAPYVINGLFADDAAVTAGSYGDFLITSDDPVTGPTRNIWGRLWGYRTYLPFVQR
jgi:hypothetical protein